MKKTTQAIAAAQAVGDVGDGEQIVVDHARGRWGAVPICLLEDKRVSLSTRAILVWFVTRDASWRFRRSQFLCALGIGLDGWQAARRQMIHAGYLRTWQTRPVQGRFAAPAYKLNPYAAELAVAATAPGVAGPGDAGPGVTGPGQARPLTTRSVSTQSIETPQPLRARAAPVVAEGGGDQGQEQHGGQGSPFGAVAPAGTGVGLGGLLADVLTRSVAARVDAESLGASPEQLQLAAGAFRATLAAGKVRVLPALAMQLARRAARGDVTPPASAVAAMVAATTPSPWPARAALAGSWIDLDGAALHVEPGGQSWRKRGSNLVVAGAAALRLWGQVDAGELALHAPVQ